MKSFLFIGLLLVSNFGFTENPEKTFNRMPASKADVLAEVKEHVTALLQQTMKLEDTDEVACTIAPRTFVNLLMLKLAARSKEKVKKRIFKLPKSFIV